MQPFDRYPQSSLAVSVLAAQMFCEQKVDLWLDDPGERIAIPRSLEDQLVSVAVLPDSDVAPELVHGKRYADRAEDGRDAHAALMPLDALWTGLMPAPGSWGEGPSVIMEPRLRGSYLDLPLIGRPDIVWGDGPRVLAIFDYKTKQKPHLYLYLYLYLYPDHQAQLWAYGYLLDTAGWIADALILGVVFVPSWKLRESLASFTDTAAARVARTLLREAEALVAAEPAKRTWYRRDSRVYRATQVHLGLFRYERQKAESELAFCRAYWLGRRAPIPTKQPNKCRECLYNALRLCPVALGPYERKLPPLL